MTLRLPPGMTRPSIPPNPDRARITPEMWEFTSCVLALEPLDFVYAGIFADKRGYHQTVAANLSRWPGDYSVRLTADTNGVRDKARALDVKSRQAASGAAPTIMAKYGARMRAAAKARDPRVRHWREVLGQFDTDSPPEAIDFQSTVERVPDDTHTWHFHWSILASYVALPEAYDGMLSVLTGESLDSWTAIRSGGNEVNLTDQLQTGPGAFKLPGGWTVDNALSYGGRAAEAAARDSALALAEVRALRGVITDLVGHITAGNGDLSVAAILDGVDERLKRLAVEQRDAIADLGEGGSAKVRADADDSQPPG